MTSVRLLNRGFLIAPNLPPRFLGNLFFGAMLVPLTRIYSCAGFVVFRKTPVEKSCLNAETKPKACLSVALLTCQAVSISQMSLEDSKVKSADDR